MNRKLWCSGLVWALGFALVFGAANTVSAQNKSEKSAGAGAEPLFTSVMVVVQCPADAICAIEPEVFAKEEETAIPELTLVASVWIINRLAPPSITTKAAL